MGLDTASACVAQTLLSVTCNFFRRMQAQAGVPPPLPGKTGPIWGPRACATQTCCSPKKKNGCVPAAAHRFFPFLKQAEGLAAFTATVSTLQPAPRSATRTPLAGTDPLPCKKLRGLRIAPGPNRSFGSRLRRHLLENEA